MSVTGLTDQEAYELLIKYSGGEFGLSMIKDMIAIAGVDKTIENITKAYKNHSKQDFNNHFAAWIKQSILFLEAKMKTEN